MSGRAENIQEIYALYCSNMRRKRQLPDTFEVWINSYVLSIKRQLRDSFDRLSRTEQNVAALKWERESVCVWQNMGYDADWVTYSTACNGEWNIVDSDADPTYCPSCGRKIKIGE